MQGRTRQKVSADHLQAISARSVRSEHQGGRIDCLLDQRNLALVHVEVDQLWLPERLQSHTVRTESALSGAPGLYFTSINAKP